MSHATATGGPMAEQATETGQWAIVEIMGHKVVAGYVSKDEMFGKPLVRIDVPGTSAYPQFTQHYGVDSIYCITYVSEDVARRAAEAGKVNPVSVYVPELAELENLRQQNDQLKKRLDETRALPAPAGGFANKPGTPTIREPDWDGEDDEEDEYDDD